MNIWRPKSATNTDPLFLVERNGVVNPLSRSAAYQSIKRYITITTGREDLSPHSLRHSCASFLVSNGMNTRDLQTILGHSSLMETERYAQLLNPDKRPVDNASKIFAEIFSGEEEKPQKRRKV